MRKSLIVAAASLLALATLASAQTPPPVPREFRAVWVATVHNIDWPSKPGLSTWEQQRELLAILDSAAAMKLNAVIFQIRSGADAMYDSPYEPWSEYLTGREGRAPEPPWDPLAFAVTEAHKRGLELHAWFNPYRAAYVTDSTHATTHVVSAHPELVHTYGHFVWMDPGDSAVRQRAVRAVVDVVKRYDVDGVHIDDYFYPYPENDSTGKPIEFPDSATYARYVRGGGTLSKDDWRRRNVDELVEALYKGVRAAKPWVKVGVSPFGIWRPGNPPQITGFDAYSKIYADSKKWLQNGWLDYLAPQLYWPIAPPQQSFTALYDWWRAQNTTHRHIWVGLGTYRIGATNATHIPSDEIVAEIDSMRARGGDLGHIHFNASTLMRGRDSLDAKLAVLYAEPALVPASPWLGATRPGRPSVRRRRDPESNDETILMSPGTGPKVWLWTVRTQVDSGWTTEILPGWLRVHRLPEGAGDATQVYVTAVSRTGVESLATRVTPRAP